MDHRNDWLEAIVALPPQHVLQHGHRHLRLGPDQTGSPDHRKGYVQLIDATQWSTPLRKNLGQKNCELSPGNVRQIIDAFMDFENTEQSKIFPNEAFRVLEGDGDRPLRLAGTDPERVYKIAEIKKLKADNEKDENAAPIIRKILASGNRW